MINIIIIKYITSLALLILLMIGYAHGQEVLTQQRARELALERSPELSIASMQIKMAVNQKAVAVSTRFPSVTANATTVYQSESIEMDLVLPTKIPNPVTGVLEPNLLLDPVTGQPVIGLDGNPLFNLYAWLPLEVKLHGAYLLGITAQQPIFTGGRINTGNRMADIGLDMAAENFRHVRMNVISAADQAYWTFITVSQKAKLAAEAVSMLEEFVRLAQNSYEVGMVGHNDVLMAKVEYNKARLNLKKAQNGLMLSRMDLARIVGWPLDTEIVASDTLITPTDSIPHILNQINLSYRPELRLLEKKVEMSKQNISMVRADFLPEVGIQIGYNHVGGVEFGQRYFSNTTFNAIGSVRIPIFQWGQGKRQISSARLQLEMDRAELKRNKEFMQLEAIQARMNLLLAWERLQINQFALDYSHENLIMVRNGYELGTKTMTDLILAQTKWQEAYTELIDANSDFQIKQTGWLRATGVLGE